MTSILILILTRCLAGVPFSWFRSSKCMYYYYYYTMVDIDLHFNIIVLVPFKYYLLQTYSWMSPFIINMIINQTYKKHNAHVVAGFFFPFGESVPFCLALIYLNRFHWCEYKCWPFVWPPDKTSTWFVWAALIIIRHGALFFIHGFRVFVQNTRVLIYLFYMQR